LILIGVVAFIFMSWIGGSKEDTVEESSKVILEQMFIVNYLKTPVEVDGRTAEMFELLSLIETSSEDGSFVGEDYKKISRLVRHDTQGIIQKTILRVTTRDFLDLDLHARKAEKDINTTDYPETEINKINGAEESAKNSTEKAKKHKERLDTTTYLGGAKKVVTPKEEEEKEVKTEPGSSPEHKKSYKPASEEEKARLTKALNQPKREVSKDVLVGPRGEPIRNIRHEEPTSIRQEQPPQEIQEVFEHFSQ